MANGNRSGGIGLLGVLIGAVLVIAVGYFFLVYRGSESTTPAVKIETPTKVPVPKS